MTPAEVLQTRTAPVIAAAAVAVVVLSAALFSLVGVVRGDSAQADEVAAPATTPSPIDSADDGAAPAGDGASAGQTEAAAPTDDATSDAAADADESTADSESNDGAVSDDATEDDATDEPPVDVDPASVSIQVLDAAGDGGAAAATTADQLREAGFNVIVVNGASRGYAVTTVFWTEGQGPGGRAVAATIGAGEARATPDEVSLSDSVDVHVVVGADKT